MLLLDIMKKRQTIYDLGKDLAISKDEVTGGNSNETIQKIKRFKNAKATVLIYKDHEPTQNLVENFPLYADNFPYWATQESGFLQHALWLAYTEAGIGANLQHYNPLIDEKVAREFNVPSNWELVAQMVVGSKPEIEDKVREYVDTSVIVK